MVGVLENKLRSNNPSMTSPLRKWIKDALGVEMELGIVSSLEDIYQPYCTKLSGKQSSKVTKIPLTGKRFELYQKSFRFSLERTYLLVFTGND
jgi:hypothetical protein